MTKGGSIRGLGVLELQGGGAKDEVKGRGGRTGGKVVGRDGRDGVGAFDEGGNKDGAHGDRSCCTECDRGDIGKNIEGGQGTREVDALWFRGEEA